MFDGWYRCRQLGQRVMVWAGFRVSPRWGQWVMPPVGWCLVARGLVSRGAWGGRWLLVCGARGFLRPCAGIGLCCRRCVVLSAPPLGGRCGIASVSGGCALWWCAGVVRAMLWCWRVASCRSLAAHSCWGLGGSARDGTRAPAAPAVLHGLGWVRIDALDELGYRGCQSRQGSVLGSDSPGRLGVLELDQ